MNQPWLEQQRRNVDSRQAWAEFDAHRQRVTTHLVRGYGDGQSRLCVLGAGNCNDLCLQQLLSAYAEVHLVDIDGEALATGIARQGCADSTTLYEHAAIDVSGLRFPPFNVREMFARLPIGQSFSLSWCEQLPGPFDVVTSIGLLSQLIEFVVEMTSGDEARMMAWIAALREHHLRAMLEMTRPGGWGMLITDFVSSESCTALASVSDGQLPGLVEQLLAERNFFHGLNPFVLRSLLLPPSTLASEISECQLVRPWRWQLGRRIYAVCALKYRRQAV